MSEMLKLLAAERTRHGARNLVDLLLRTPPEKLDWRPLGCGRSILDQAIECALVNKKWATTLRLGAYTRVSAEIEAEAGASGRDLNLLRQLLQDSAEELVTAIQTLHANDLENQITAPFGTYTMAQCCFLGYWNMVYHEGQINYIHTLYGDDKLHVHF